jgi:hypothetical protein
MTSSPPPATAAAPVFGVFGVLSLVSSAFVFAPAAGRFTRVDLPARARGNFWRTIHDDESEDHNATRVAPLRWWSYSFRAGKMT